jgi:transglutaminase-like putative cysteine protease
VTGAKAGTVVCVWVPVPPTTADQKVKLVERVLPAGSAKETEATEPVYGNRIFSFEAKADTKGEVPFAFVYEVTRKELRGESGKATKEEAKRIARFLEPDALVPITGKPLELLDGKKLPADPMGKARVMYDVVNDHMKYSKEVAGWGRGDSVWACDSKSGNCSDFHSLFISMARAKKVPAKFEIGFSLPEKHGAGPIAGYHCWAFFRPDGKGWVPVDISEANKNPMMRDYYFGNLTADRIGFSTGRDVNLVPKQAGKRLNFFIYPYAEVGGKEVAQEKIVKKFAFADVK